MQSTLIKYFILLVGVITIESVCGQSVKGTVRNYNKRILKGTVQDEQGNTIPYANIGVYFIKGADTNLIRGAASNLVGEFRIVVPGNKPANIQVSFLSYKTLWKTGIVIKDSLNLGVLTLSPSAALLEEAVIERERSQMELKLDKRVFNVGKDITNAGGSASDVLEKVPSVEVDMDGNVSLRGSENIRILINGKPSGLLAGNLADALKQLNGANIKSIEVITNPSARFDAEGEVGIINIIMKKETKEGWTGNVNVTAGLPETLRSLFNVSYSNRKITLYGGMSGNYWKMIGRGLATQQFLFEDTSYAFRRTRNHERGGANGSLNGGVDYFFNKQSLLNLTAKYWQGVSDNVTTNDYIDFDSYGIETSQEQRKEKEKGWNTGYALELNFYKSFKKHKGREFNTSISYNGRNSDENGEIVEYFNGLLTDLDQKSVTIGNRTSLFFQSDFILPLKKKDKLEFGAKHSDVKDDQDYTMTQLLGSEYRSIEGFDNHLIYDEHISALYAMYSKELKKLSYQVGLRGEYSDVTTNLLQTNERNQRKYGYLFPSAHFSYEKKKDTLYYQFGYSRRISRPRSWWLNPFYGLSDDRYFFVGNPNLDPSITDALELTYLRKFTEGSYMLSGYYRYSQEIMQRVLIVDSFGVSILQPQNIGIENSFGIEFSGRYDLTKKWNVSAGMNLFRSIVDGQYEDIILVADALNWRGNISARMRMKRGWRLQASGRFNAPNNSIQGRRLAMYVLDLGFSKTVMKRKGNISFSLRDVFNSRMRRSINEGEFFYSESMFQWRSRSAILNFSYRFNPEKKRASPKKRNNADGNYNEQEMGM